MHQHQNQAYRWLNLLFYLGVIVVNILSFTLPLGGNSTKAISDMYHTLLTPAGYAFAIWTVIYAGLGGFILYQFFSSPASGKWIEAFSPAFIMSCLFNMAWLILWHYLYIEASLLAIIGLLAMLLIIYRHVAKLRTPTLGQRWLVQVPFSLYAAWVTVATIVNVSIVLQKNNWDGWGLSPTAWAVIMLCVGAVLAVWASWPYSNIVYPLVFVWAYVAIAVEQRDNSRVFLTALTLAAILLVYAIALIPAKLRVRQAV